MTKKKIQKDKSSLINGKPENIKELRHFLAQDFVEFCKYSLKYLNNEPGKIQLEIADFLQSR